jgi:hypothetical protein
LIIEPEEHAEDRAARIRQSSRELLIGQIVNGAVVIGFIAAGIFSGFLIFSANATTADWARNAFTAIVAGGVSFFTGREVGRGR